MRPTSLIVLLLTGCSANPTRVQHEAVEPAPSPLTAEVQPLLVTSFGVWSGDVLFAEERAELAEAVIERVNEGDMGPYTAESYSTAKARWDALLKGTYPNGKQCADVPSPNAIERALRADAPELNARIDCKDDCQLRVSVLDRAKKQSRLVDVVMTLPQERAQWLGAIRGGEFQPHTPDPVGGIGISGYDPSKLKEPKVALRSAELDGAWNSTSKDMTPMFQAQVEQFRQCRASHKRIHRDWWANNYVLNVNASGQVTRCEQAIEDHLPDPWFACECNVIKSSIQFGAGADNRRLRTAIDILEPRVVKDGSVPVPMNDGLRRSAYLGSEQTSGDDPLSRAIGVNALAYRAFDTCFQHLPKQEIKVEVPVSFVMDGTGATQSVSAQWPDSIPQAFAQCATPVLQTADFACPINESATLQTVLKVSVYK